LTKNNFIFGRVLVLAEVSLELQYFGAPEWSKKISDIGNFNDKGLSCQKFPVYFGDKNRVSDGFCCGFYDDFSKGFPAFGIKSDDNGYLSKPTFGISSEDDRKNVTLLFDPMLKVTLNTGILPVKQIELCEEHTDFSGYNLMTACMNNMLSGESKAEMPVFAKDKNFVREYPTLEGYHEIEIVKPYNSVTQLGKTIITDGLLSERK
jgi:hypothetical protein